MAEEGDLDDDALADTLEGMEDEWLDKMDSCVYVIKLLQGALDVYDKEIKAMQDKKASLERNITRINSAMFKSIKLRYPGEKSKPTNKKRFSFWTQYSAKSLDTYDVEAIPKEYFIPQPAKLDTSKLLEDMKELEGAGKELPFGVTLKSTEYLRWR